MMRQFHSRAAAAPRGSTVRRPVEVVAGREQDLGRRTRRDLLAAEEPLEIRMVRAEEAAGPAPLAETAHRVAVTMRTPGDDFELAAGFLFAESLLNSPRDVAAIRYCVDAVRDGAQQYNIVNVVLAPGVPFDPGAVQRNFYTTSSCGVCGKASIDAVQELACAPVQSDLVVEGQVLLSLPDTLRAAQRVFERTGGLHAAALFSTTGELLCLREDVGRHNALDKLIGHALLSGQLPLAGRILLVSGRLSFELVQKAARASVAVLAGVSAPSSLAAELADALGITLVGFLREDRFNIYAGGHRVATTRGAAPVPARPPPA